MPTLPETIKIMTGLVALYPNFTLHEATFTAYHRILEDIPAPLLDTAALHLGSTSRFYPAAAELRQAAFELAQAGGYGLPHPEEAWAEVTAGLSRWGRYAAPEWTTPMIKEAIRRTGGWINLCNSTNFPADRARFLQAYGRLVKREKSMLEMLPEVRNVVKALADGMDATRLFLPGGNGQAAKAQAVAPTGVRGLTEK